MNPELRLARIMKSALKVLLLIILLAVAVIAAYMISIDKSIPSTIIISLCSVVFTITVILILQRYFIKKEKYTQAVVFLIALGIILRFTWIFTVKTEPLSDFDTMYQLGAQIAKGDFSMFKGFSYIARFPHLTVFCLFLGLAHKLFNDPLIAVKLINASLSGVNLYIIFLISREFFSDKKKVVYTVLTAALFPAFIIYTSVICTENIAIPFYLLSLYLFIKVMNGKIKNIWLVLSGLLLLTGHLFRGVAYVMLFAYLIYIIIHEGKSNADTLFQRCAAIAGKISLLLLSFIIPFIICNYTLKAANITEYDLWNGSEPFITSVLKGTNIDHIGMWNEDDASLPGRSNGNYEEIQKAALDEIRERLSTTPPLKFAGFLIMKFSGQWSVGDYGGLSNAVAKVDGNVIVSEEAEGLYLYNQLIYFLLLLLMLEGLFKKPRRNEAHVLNLLYIILFGYMLFYLITEMQPRYAFIISWIFVFLPWAYNDFRLFVNKTDKTV